MFEDLCLKETLSEARMVGALPKPRQFHERILLVPNNRNVRSQVEPENKRVVRKRKSTLRKSQSTWKREKPKQHWGQPNWFFEAIKQIPQHRWDQKIELKFWPRSRKLKSRKLKRPSRMMKKDVLLEGENREKQSQSLLEKIPSLFLTGSRSGFNRFILII